jgi:hypothetical protein
VARTPYLSASPGLKAKRLDITFDAELLTTEKYPWTDAIAHTTFGPSRLFEEVVFSHHPSHTLILTDLIINAKTDSYNLFQKLFSAFDGLSYPNGSTPRLYRWSIKSKKATREVYQTMIDWARRKSSLAMVSGFAKMA